jgi:hypothetical protein
VGVAVPLGTRAEAAWQGVTGGRAAARSTHAPAQLRRVASWFNLTYVWAMPSSCGTRQGTKIVSAAFVALVVMAVGSTPAAAKRAKGEIVRAACGSQVVNEWGDTTTLQRVMSLSVEYDPREDRNHLALQLGSDSPGRIVDVIDEIGEIIRGVPTAARSFSGSVWDYELRDGFVELLRHTQVTVSGTTWLKVELRLGRRKISLGPIEPKWFADPEKWLDYPGRAPNAAVGGMSNWQLGISLRKHIKQVRRHEAKGGKVRVRFKYHFPETTEVVTFSPTFEPFTVVRTYSAATCGATSRPLRLVVG